MARLDPLAIRPEFPALGLDVDGRPAAFFDGPGGTQVHGSVIEAMTAYLVEANANAGGLFLTSERGDERVEVARAAVADLYGAASPDEIKFGQNMTSLTFHLSRSILATMGPGDEIVVTTLDHEANVSPWRTAAADRGVEVRTVDIRPDDVTLDLDDLDRALSKRTRLVAVGFASNAIGTINPVAEVVRRAHAVGAWTYVDAVAYAPHGPIDVRGLESEFLVSSAYKWFGPHVAALYGRAEVLAALPAYKVRPAHDRFETGTQSFESICGAGAAVEYLAGLGPRFGDAGEGATRRERILAGMAAIRAHELDLHARLMAGLRSIPGVRTWGPGDLDAAATQKVPTISITIQGARPEAAARYLATRGIFAWDGHFYAQALIERLGLAEAGGVLRLGIVHYNTAEEVDRMLEAVEAVATGAQAALAARS
jgi:cysteine desulfurase family protein (TIGR01976 family)